MSESAHRRSANEQSSSPELSTTERILDLLLDALLERQAARQAEPEPDTTPSPAPQPTPRRALRQTQGGPQDAAAEPSAPEPTTERPAEESWTAPPPLPSINLGRTLSRLLLVLAALVVAINVPINRYGTSLARIMPDTAALVIRDGLVLKGSGADIYVLQDNKLRWISSLDAFEFFGYRWEQVHVVDDSFLEEFEKGRPIHVLLKCDGSPHIYALENGQKRWIRDIPTFEVEGYVWGDVKTVGCDYLRDLPDGPTIPEDAGPPPQP